MRPLLLILLASVFGFFPSTVFSGEIRVTPVKLFFDQQFKNGIITVINEGDEPIQVEINAAEWTQDAEGKDQYHETKDLIFFPKILKMEKGEQRAVRAGIKSAAVSQEKTYRLFIKELPKATPETQGAQVRFAVQFAVPIFVKPVKEEIKGEITKLTYGNGQLGFDVRNTGNAHFRINSIIIKGVDGNGVETFSQEISGWYLLAGAMRSYGTPVTREICEDTAKFAVEVKSDQVTLNEKLDVIKTLCLP
jgi:fimbrial chaperone protein